MGTSPASNVGNPANPGGGAGRGQSNAQNRAGGRAKARNNRNKGKSERPPQVTFSGKEDGLGDEFVYQHTQGRDASNQYMKTTEEIVRYVSTKFKSGGDVSRSLQDRTLLPIVYPTAPSATTVAGTTLAPSESETVIWKMELQAAMHRKNLLATNLESAYALIWGQCSEAIQEKVTSQPDYSTILQARDAIGLLELIKDSMFAYSSGRYRAMAIVDFLKLDLTSQTRYMSANDYVDKFRNQLDVLKSIGGEICVHPGLVQDEHIAAGTTTQNPVAHLAAVAKARSRFEGALFLAKSDQRRYGALLQELANDYNKGVDNYPKNLGKAFDYILNDVRYLDKRDNDDTGVPGLAFAQGGEATVVKASNTQPNPRPDIECNRCNKAGHFSNKCAETHGADGTVLCIVVTPEPEATQPSGGVVTGSTSTLLHDVSVTAEDFADVEGFHFANVGVAVCVTIPEDEYDSDDSDDGPPPLSNRWDESGYESSDDDDSCSGFDFMNDGTVCGTESGDVIVSRMPVLLNHVGSSGKIDDGKLCHQHKSSTGQSMPQSWILLDSQSTVDVFCNMKLLKNIRKSHNSCRISCNAGVVTTNLIGDLPGYPVPVWFYAGGIANILSLHRVAAHCRIKYDSETHRAAFRVIKSDGSVREFVPSVSGLHYFDTVEHGVALVNTVAKNKEKYTNRAIKQATLARRIQDTVGRPSTRDFLKIVDKGGIEGCPINRSDILAAEDIYGPNLGSLKGKTVRRKSEHVPSHVADVPYRVIKMYKDVTLCFDIMFMNKTPFMVTVSRNIRFGTTERLASRHSNVVAKAVVNVIKFYQQRGFRVKESHGDGEFEPIRGDLADAGCNLNLASEGEHVPEIERRIRTLKERGRCAYNTVPFKVMPKVMEVELVHGSNYWLNMFASNDGVSDTLSPRKILTGQSADYRKHCQIMFGEYAQVHESHDNTMASRTTGAIALRPTGNVQGGYFFMSLSSGKRLNRYKWTPLPMPAEVIERVHALANNNVAGGQILYGWRDGTEITDEPGDEDDLHDEDYSDGSASDNDSSTEDELDADEGVENDDDSDFDDDDSDFEDEEDDSSDTDDDVEPPPLAPRTDSDSDDPDDDVPALANRTHRPDSDDDGSDDDLGDESDGSDSDTGHDGVDSDEDSEDDSDDDAEPPQLLSRPADDSGEDSDSTDDELPSVSSRITRSGGLPPRRPTPPKRASRPEGVATRRSTRRRTRAKQVRFTTTSERTDVATDPHTTEGVPTANEGVHSANEGVHNANEGVRNATDTDTRYEPHRRAGLRPRKAPRSSEEIKLPRSAAHRVRRIKNNHLNAMLAAELEGLRGFTEVHHTALIQYNARKGIELFGDRAVDAITKEMKQLHDRDTICPQYSKDLSREDKKKALGYLMFIKEKRCGTIKGRGCADGRKQRLWKDKSETSSPTVRTESLLLSCVIDAKEKRAVVTCDVPGAFMQVDVDEVIHVRLEGAMAVLLSKVDPKLYEKYLVQEGGKTVMYVRLKKALYGTLQAALLFWMDLTEFLTEEGFIPNPYDRCVMNKMVNGKQCTVLWHVDDLKFSHVESEVIEDILVKLNKKYGKIAPLTVTRGDLHDYLGMTLDFSVMGEVAIRMEDYVENMLEELPDSWIGVSKTPAASYLFKVDKSSPDLNNDESDLFHSVTAKLLFLCKRARPDIQTPVAFLCTRVSKPNESDTKKLKRVIQYLRGTKTLCLTLSADDLLVVKWWVDASFAVHDDMRSHTGGTMSLGKGAIYSTSTRQKINTTSSTEAELVGAGDVMPQILWTRRFMIGQGYNITDNILYQDNQSAMLLELNGQRSSTRRTRHLDIRYFFITDCVRAKLLSIEYCPTGDMWADVYTKPLQGAAFIKFRQLVLNLR